MVNLLYLLDLMNLRCSLLLLLKQNYSENSEVFSSASVKAELFSKIFPQNFILDHSSIFLPAFLSRTNLKLHNIYLSPKFVKKVITNLALSKTSGPDCILVAVLKKSETELSCMLAELFNICLKESCFPDYWKVSSVVPVFKNVRKKSIAKNYRSVSLLSVICKSLWKTCNRIVITSRNVASFLISNVVSGLNVQLIVVSDRIARAFNRSGAIWAVALDISKDVDRVWHAGHLHKFD